MPSQVLIFFILLPLSKTPGLIFPEGYQWRIYLPDVIHGISANWLLQTIFPRTKAARCRFVPLVFHCIYLSFQATCSLGSLEWLLISPWLLYTLYWISLWNVRRQRKWLYLHGRATWASDRCIKARPHAVPSVSDSCSLAQEALCACSERKKKWVACLNGAFVIWAGEHKKQRENTWTLCASNTSALHLIQCQHMPPLCAIVPGFLSVRNIFFSIKATVLRALEWAVLLNATFLGLQESKASLTVLKINKLKKPDLVKIVHIKN